MNLVETDCSIVDPHSSSWMKDTDSEEKEKDH